MLRLHICERDRWQGRPLYEAIVGRCRELQIAGATVFRGLEGYGETAEIHRGGVLAHDLPILIAIIDTSENIDRLIPEMERMMSTGVLAVSEVQMVRVNRSTPRP
jgi:PII-like signaling protein